MLKKNIVLRGGFLMVVLILVGCTNTGKKLQPAFESITADDLAKHIEILSSDEFMGRAPSSPGEEKTIHYLENEFTKLGLKPGNGESYFQEVPLVKMTVDPSVEIKITGNNKTLKLKYGEDFIGGTSRVVKSVSIRDSEIVFVGYGIVAPEYQWNDYAGLNVKGKTVLVLVNDPGFVTKDSTLFNGFAMTYYGRWTYKYEEAARQGAAGVIIVHETEPAGYPWEVVRNSWSGPQFYLETEDGNMSDCEFRGWITLASAKKIFAMAGLEYEKQAEAASQRGFRASVLPLKATVLVHNTVDFKKSNNVVAVWPGSERPDEYVIYNAHWDHFGVNSALPGDSILNGALDNATGTSALIELAEAFTKLPEHPKRSVLFLAVTCEEQGLLGSGYYATHPIYPLNKTVAVINMDALNIFGRMKDITSIGYGNSELDDYVRIAAKKQNRYISPDPSPEKGSFFRSDHFPFAKVGLPALYLSKGVDHVEKGREWTMEQSDKWLKENYHKPSDEYDPDVWDFTGMVDDVRLFFRVGYLLSMEDRFPNWREGVLFKGKRDAMMGK